MRTLNKNKRKLYKVTFLGSADQKDAYGNFTGEKVRQYSVPQEVWVNFRVMSGIIKNEIFGTHSDYDMTAISSVPMFEKDDLLFNEYPPAGSDYLTTYDLKVEAISESLTNISYGFRRRI